MSCSGFLKNSANLLQTSSDIIWREFCKQTVKLMYATRKSVRWLQNFQGVFGSACSPLLGPCAWQPDPRKCRRWCKVQGETFKKKARGCGLTHLPPRHPPRVLGRRCASGSFGGSWPQSAGSAGRCVGPSECGPHLGTAGGSSWPPPSPVGSVAPRCAGSGPSLLNTHRISNLSAEIKPSRLSYEWKLAQKPTIRGSVHNQEVFILQLGNFLQHRCSLKPPPEGY